MHSLRYKKKGLRRRVPVLAVAEVEREAKKRWRIKTFDFLSLVVIYNRLSDVAPFVCLNYIINIRTYCGRLRGRKKNRVKNKTPIYRNKQKIINGCFFLYIQYFTCGTPLGRIALPPSK